MKQTNLRNHVREIAAFLACAALVLVQAMPASAADWQEPLEYASYDMGVGGTQTFHIIDEDGEESIITVTELQSTSRVANGAYRIEHTKRNFWTAGFKISVSNNCITSAYGKYYTTLGGPISNDTLQLDGNKQATYKFIQRNNGLTVNTGLRCIIIGEKINIYAL
jgi:opacity protein-like surface antigen